MVTPPIDTLTHSGGAGSCPSRGPARRRMAVADRIRQRLEQRLGGQVVSPPGRGGGSAVPGGRDFHGPAGRSASAPTYPAAGSRSVRPLSPETWDRRLEGVFGGKTYTYIRSFSCYVAHMIKDISKQYLGLSRPEHGRGALPYADTTALLAGAFFRVLGDRAGAAERCQRVVDAFTPAAAKATHTIISSLLLNVTGRLEKSLEPEEATADGIQRPRIAVTAKLQSMSDFAERLKRIFMDYTEAMERSREFRLRVGRPLDHGGVSIERYYDHFAEKMTAQHAGGSPLYLVRGGNQRMVEAATYYDNCLAEILVEKLYAEITTDMQGGHSELVRYAQQLLGVMEGERDAQIKRMLASIVGNVINSTRNSVMDPTALRGYIATALKNSNEVLRQRHTAMARGGEPEDPLAPLPPEDFPPARQVAEMMGAATAMFLPNGQLLRRVMPSFAPLITSTLVSMMHKGGGHYMHTHELVEAMFSMCEGQISEDGHMWRRPPDMTEVVWEGLTIEERVAAQRAYEQRRDGVDGAAGVTAEVMEERQRARERLDREISQSVRSVMRYINRPEVLFNGVIANRFRQVFQEDSQSYKVTKAFWFTMYYLRYNMLVRVVSHVLGTLLDFLRVCIIDFQRVVFSFINRTVGRLSYEQRLQQRIQDFVENPVRHGVFSEILEEAFMKLELVTARELDGVHERVRNFISAGYRHPGLITPPPAETEGAGEAVEEGGGGPGDDIEDA